MSAFAKKWRALFCFVLKLINYICKFEFNVRISRIQMNDSSYLMLTKKSKEGIV